VYVVPMVGRFEILGGINCHVARHVARHRGHFRPFVPFTLVGASYEQPPFARTEQANSSAEGLQEQPAAIRFKSLRELNAEHLGFVTIQEPGRVWEDSARMLPGAE
jgi:hypothetical protein